VGRLALLAVIVATLAAFATALPAYRSTFTDAIDSAGFDVDVAGCTCTAEMLADVRARNDVSAAAGVLGLIDVPIAAAGRSVVVHFAWALDREEDGWFTPIGPARLLAGEFALGTPDRPSVVIDSEIANDLETTVGDTVTITIGHRPWSATVAGVAHTAARFRGSSIALLRSFAVDHMDQGALLGDYTEVLLTGTITPEQAVSALGGKGAAVAYSKDEIRSTLESEIEVSAPVIDLISWFSVIALTGFLLLAGRMAFERRAPHLRLLSQLGATPTEVSLAFALLEAGSASLIAAVASVIGVQVILNAWFTRALVHVEWVPSLGVGLLAGGLCLVGHALALYRGRRDLGC
jgi:hypothetical protein